MTLKEFLYHVQIDAKPIWWMHWYLKSMLKFFKRNKGKYKKEIWQPIKLHYIIILIFKKMHPMSAPGMMWMKGMTWQKVNLICSNLKWCINVKTVKKLFKMVVQNRLQHLKLCMAHKCQIRRGIHQKIILCKFAVFPKIKNSTKSS